MVLIMFLKNDEIKKQIQKTNIEKFGVDNVFKNGEVITKIKQTNLERYDTDIPSKNVDIKNKKAI